MIKKFIYVTIISFLPSGLFAQDLSENQVEFLGKILGGTFECREVISTTLGLDTNYNKFVKEAESVLRSIAKDYPKFAEFFDKSMNNVKMDNEIEKIITCLPIASFIEGYYLSK